MACRPKRPLLLTPDLRNITHLTGIYLHGNREDKGTVTFFTISCLTGRIIGTRTGYTEILKWILICIINSLSFTQSFNDRKLMQRKVGLINNAELCWNKMLSNIFKFCQTSAILSITRYKHAENVSEFSINPLMLYPDWLRY